MKFIVANWKMLPESLAQAQEILEFTNESLESMVGKEALSLVFCPPFVFTEEIAKLLKMSHLEDIAFLGAQDVAEEDKAALTGEVSGLMLRRLGVSYVIIGHSERRWKLNEPDTIVHKKLKAALRNELIPIVCIGERTREDNFKEFLENQIDKTFEGLTSDEVGRCIIAYEPVWAISTNPGAKPDTPSSALESIRIIAQVLISKFEIRNSKLLYLYGGSVNSNNVESFLREKEIDGVLVGGASVNKEEFSKILKVAFRIK